MIFISALNEHVTLQTVAKSSPLIGLNSSMMKGYVTYFLKSVFTTGGGVPWRTFQHFPRLLLEDTHFHR